MNQQRSKRFQKKEKAPFIGRFLRRRVGIEQLCDDCSRPYLTKAEIQPLEQFVHGSAVALVFPEERFGKRNYYVQFGRYTTDGSRILFSQMLGDEHLRDIVEVAEMAHRFIREQRPLRLVSRR